MPSIQSRIIAREDDYWITLHRAGERPTRKVVVTFGGQPSTLWERGFGTDFVLGQGMDTIYVAQRLGTQYQGLSIDAFVQWMAPVLADHDDVIAYGSSLGGYAALYFGGCVNARIIAAAPMFPAWRPLGNKAYAAVPVHHAELRDVPRSRHAPVAIYDPMLRLDQKVVDEMVRPAYPALREVKVPHASHKVLMALERVKLLKPLIMGIVERDEVIPMDLPGEGTAIWHGERGIALRLSAPEEAERELKRSLEIKPSKRYYNELIKHLIRSGRTDEARHWLTLGRLSDDRQLGLVESMRPIVEGAGLRMD